MNTVTLTDHMRVNRTVVSDFALAFDVPPHVRNALSTGLRDHAPQEVTDEQLGWVLSAASGALLSLVLMHRANGGDPADLINLNLLAAMASASEEFITSTELPEVK